ncbi:STAS domain-containing protein [Rubrimonas cliftonensis]|uniref:Chemotaxis protein CheX n=1 Tax=Rubrimonas cliftonensis TaxID=89524 RepID=A0A1H4DSY8_9RHOB|nr:STAS domain-containing protein [Rubrimonas cliftonensis]SEA75696.1 chemotaxis protein CheX [Rubrimonas cliftonensis]
MKDLADEGATRLALPDVLDSAAAPGLADSFRTVRGAAVTVDGGAVKRLGGLCAQVLLSAAASWRADGSELNLENPSEEMTDALRLMGLEPASLTSGDHTA